MSAGTKTYSYDDAFRITGLTDTSPGAANWTYGYDNLDRLMSGTSPSITRGCTYDANGNRLTETGSAPSTYTLSTTSNRITGIMGALAHTYAYDAAGNITGYSTVTTTYNNAGRLHTLTNGSSTETTLYNALGQRIEISGGINGTILYAYDEAGHFLGEYDATGTPIEETVWLGDIPVATLRPSGATVSIYYVHSDALNTPRQVTRPSDNTPMWTWNSDPFGTDAANPNPAGAGAVAYNLRFPGQVFDGQAGLHQNMARDYDPASGRYVESDPVGLAGRSYSTFAYGNGSPIANVDPTGLLVRGDGWSNKQWNDIEKAEAKIRKELSKGCSCHRNSAGDGYIPCNLLPPLLNSLDTMVVSYAPLGGDCGWTPPSTPPHGLFLSTVPWGKVPGETCKPGCLTSTLYHELLHTTNLIFDDSNPPAAIYEGKCIGDLCKKGAP